MKQLPFIGHLRQRILLAILFFGVAGFAVAGTLTALHAASASTVVTGKNILSTGQKFTVGQQLASPNGQYILSIQSSGNITINGDLACITWMSNTIGTGTNVLIMQNDGNLVLYNSLNKPVWSSRTNGTGRNNYLSIQNDGNLVVYTSAGKAVWASGYAKASILCSPGRMWPGSYLHSPNNKYNLIMQFDGNLVLYNNATHKLLWASHTSGATGSYEVTVGIDGNVVLFYDLKPTKILWATNTAKTGNMNYLVMQNDGNLVLYNHAGAALWASGTRNG